MCSESLRCFCHILRKSATSAHFGPCSIHVTNYRSLPVLISSDFHIAKLLLWMDPKCRLYRLLFVDIISSKEMDDKLMTWTNTRNICGEWYPDNEATSVTLNQTTGYQCANFLSLSVNFLSFGFPSKKKNLLAQDVQTMKHCGSGWVGRNRKQIGCGIGWIIMDEIFHGKWCNVLYCWV